MKLFEPRGPRRVEPRDRHFPEQVPIDAYGNGGFRFAGLSHRGSLLVLPSGVHGWDPVAPADIDAAALAAVADQAEEIDTLLLGTGRGLVPLPADLRAGLREVGVGVDVMSTGAAIRIFNIMLGERRKVAAALIAVD